MKTIVLVRHAKSSWEFDVSDRERPLKKRGLNDANLVSKTFINNGFVPDIIVSSPANRALSTCQIFMENLKLNKSLLIVQEDIYDFGGNSVINFVKNLSDEHSKLMLFGHNYAFTSIVNSYGNTMIDNMPTSGLVKINFNIDHWKDLKRGETEKMIFPRDLK